MTPCREWQGYKDSYGYGRKTDRTRPGHKVSVHRWVVEQVLGRHLGSDEIVRHTCDNPPCFLYEHLRLGTQKDNIQDMIQKGRGGDHQRARGSKQGHAKLTETQVAEIKDLLGDGISPKEIGPRYGVGVTNIYNIKAGRAWRHV